VITRTTRRHGRVTGRNLEQVKMAEDYLRRYYAEYTDDGFMSAIEANLSFALRHGLPDIDSDSVLGLCS
jgi:hypothetical protein